MAAPARSPRPGRARGAGRGMPPAARSSRPGRSRVATTTLTSGWLSGTATPGEHEADSLRAGGAQPVDEAGQLAVAGPVPGDDQDGDAGLRGAHAALVGVGRWPVDHDHAG